MLRPFEKCPACGGGKANARQLFMTYLLGEPCGVLKCVDCGLVYKELSLTSDELTQVYSEDYVHFQGGGEVATSDVNSAAQKLDRCRQLLKTKRTPEELRLLDVGCGAGAFVEIAQGYGFQAEGIDPHLPDGLNRPYLWRKSPAEVAPKSYDIALLLNVAEHLVEPRQMFSEVLRLLKPNGVMLITCPYGDSLARRIYKGHWGHLRLDEHLLFWTPRSLGCALRDVGFRGRVSYRIAGSPFPFGRAESTEPLPVEQHDVEPQGHGSRKEGLSWQRRMWQMARLMQGQERLANVIRSLVNLSRSGDYLEYAIAVT